MNEDLKIIKKKYGEKMSHLCRNLFSTSLEQKGLLSKVMLEHFEPNRFLYDDIVNNDITNNFKNYIYSIVNNNEEESKIIDKTPEELLKSVGYTLYECHSEEEVQSFKKYYKKSEELCTFRNRRLDSCHVFFAVKDNVNEIKREDFKTPRRQDKYGTSVISIQFTRDESHTLSIKNRYNHTVDNPDATFSNDLENIVAGLTASFEKTYGLVQKNKTRGFEIPGYVKANDGKYYKYNYEINNIYYCPNNIIIDNFAVKRYPKEQFIIMDYFILDLRKDSNEFIRLYDKRIEDGFAKSIDKVKNITILNEGLEKKVIITPVIGTEIIIKLDKENRMIELTNNNVIKIYDDFLYHNNTLTTLNLPQVQKIGLAFLYDNETLTTINLPQVQEIGDNFLFNNNTIITLNIPKVQKIRSYFLYRNKTLTTLNLPEVKEIGDVFLYYNNKLTTLNLPQVQEIGYRFLYCNDTLTTLNLPEVYKIGEGFLFKNNTLTTLSLPQVQEIGSNFLLNNNTIEKLNMPSIQNMNYMRLKEIADLNKAKLILKHNNEDSLNNNDYENNSGGKHK